MLLCFVKFNLITPSDMFSDFFRTKSWYMSMEMLGFSCILLYWEAMSAKIFIVSLQQLP